MKELAEAKERLDLFVHKTIREKFVTADFANYLDLEELSDKICDEVRDFLDKAEEEMDKQIIEHEENNFELEAFRDELDDYITGFEEKGRKTLSVADLRRFWNRHF